MKPRLEQAVKKASRMMYRSLPIIAGVILLVGLANALVPKSLYTAVFRGNYLLDPFIGGLIGSILAGNPVTSYILGGEMLVQGISLVAVIAFMVAWVTVGIVQIPAEAMLLGKRFAITRNIASFVLSIAVAVITVIILDLI